jgi:hypothetical protein
MVIQQSLAAQNHGPGFFSRWPGLLSLIIGWIGGPLAALANQQITYMANMWACGRGHHEALHIIPLVCPGGSDSPSGFSPHRDWALAGRGVGGRGRNVSTRAADSSRCSEWGSRVSRRW